MSDNKANIQETQGTANRINPKMIYTQAFTFKLQNIKDREKNVEKTQRKNSTLPTEKQT